MPTMNKKLVLLLILALIAVGIAGRLMPHIPNATPITALVFACSLYFGRRVSLLVPLSVMFLTDFIIGFYNPVIMLSVYGSFLLVILLSWWAQKNNSIIGIGYSVLASSVVFFIITNTTVWWFSPWYEKSFAGLLYCFELALPFLRNMMIGDLLYTPALLGCLYIAYNWGNVTLSPRALLSNIPDDTHPGVLGVRA